MADETLGILIALILPLAGTTAGACLVFFLKDALGSLAQKILLGFAAGVMVAASIWSLILPSIEMAEQQQVIAWIPAVVGFLAGMFFLLLFDHLLPHQHLGANKPEGPQSGLQKQTLLIFAVALHNLPEGMAVGAVLAGFLVGNAGLSLAGVIALALGLAIQNIPEGAIISTPLRSYGLSRGRSFLYGFLSGVIEPVGAVLMLVLAETMTPALPYILSFAAGAMIYVVVEDLIPATQTGRHTNVGVIAFAFGFALMLILDVALG